MAGWRRRQSNEGVAGNIGQTRTRSANVEYAYAKQNKLTYAALINKAGKTCSRRSRVPGAASNADWAKAPGYYVILTDQPGETSWPITAATFILMHKEPTERQRPPRRQVLQMAFAKGDKMAEELDYIPMPEPVVKLIRERPGRPTSRAECKRAKCKELSVNPCSGLGAALLALLRRTGTHSTLTR